jgi:hypothetical protein
VHSEEALRDTQLPLTVGIYFIFSASVNFISFKILSLARYEYFRLCRTVSKH